MSKNATYSDFIKDWPKAKLPFDGATGHLMKSDYGQVVLFELPKGVEVPLHHHGAQWGVVVEGEIKLTIGGETHVYGPGDSYKVKEGEDHGGVTLTDCRVIDVFQEADRYQAG